MYCVVKNLLHILMLVFFMYPDSSSLSRSIYGDGNKPILLSSLQCNQEQNLLQCRRSNDYVGYHSCSLLNNNAVALRCDGKDIIYKILRVMCVFVCL